MCNMLHNGRNMAQIMRNWAYWSLDACSSELWLPHVAFHGCTSWSHASDSLEWFDWIKVIWCTVPCIEQ